MNNLISQNPTGFKPGDLCINQLISITHEIYQSFQDGLEVRGVFLDISRLLKMFGTKISRFDFGTTTIFGIYN